MYCSDLNGTVVFAVSEIKVCSPGTKYLIPSLRYEGGEFPLDEFLMLRDITQGEINDGNSPCLNCPNIKRGNARPGKYLFSTVEICNYRYCNARCSYCDSWQPEMQDTYAVRYRVYPVIKWMFDNNLIDPKGLLIWGGGEPTINVEFDEITRLAMDHRMRMFVNTSGIVYSDVLADALRNGLATVQCSLDSGDADTYIAMKGRDRFEQIVENLTLYAEKNPDNIVLKYIINDKNNSDGSIVGFLNIAKRLGITRIALSPEAKEAWAGEISIATLGAINIFLHEAKKRRLSVDVFYSLFGEEYSKLIKETCEVQTPPPDWAIRYFNRLSPGLQKRIRKVYEILRDSSLTEPD